MATPLLRHLFLEDRIGGPDIMMQLLRLGSWHCLKRACGAGQLAMTDSIHADQQGQH